MEIKRFEELLNQEKATNELQKREFSIKQESSIEGGSQINDDNMSTMYNEFLKNQVNIADLKLDVLNNEVESGLQRAEFKLTPFTTSNDIPMSKYFIENKHDLSTIYHRKMLQRIQQYATRMKSIDVKTMSMSNINLDEIKKEHNQKLQELTRKFNEDREELNEKIRVEREQKEGYASSLDYLSSYVKEMKELKDKIRDCQTCSSFIQDI